MRTEDTSTRLYDDEHGGGIYPVLDPVCSSAYGATPALS